MEYFKNDKRMPIYLRKHPDMKEIFNACTGGINDQTVCQKRLVKVKENAAFILNQNTCCIRHPFYLQADNIAGSFKRSDKVRFYKCTRNCDGLLLSTEVHVVKEGKNVIGGIVKSRIAGKWCEGDAELECVFAFVRKRSEHTETKKQGKKYVRQIFFILTLEEFNRYYYRLSEMESVSLTYSCIVVSYSGYPGSSVSNQFSIKETPNNNKRKLSAQSCRPIEHSFRKELQQKI